MATPALTERAPTAPTDAVSARSHSGGDHMQLVALSVLTYGLFLAVVVLRRLFFAPERAAHRIPRRSVFREAWDTANGMIAFAFSCR